MTAFKINGYKHGDVLLNLSGERDEEECVITRVTAADSEIDLIDLFPVNTLLSMAECADAQLAREARQANAAARVEIHQWHREFRVAA